MVFENETCVLCGQVTNICTGVHVDARDNYVDGVGQLCESCAQKVKGANKET